MNNLKFKKEYQNNIQKTIQESNSDEVNITKEIANIILGFIVCIGIVIIILIIYGLAYSNGEDNLIQKLCTKQQYDFCEVIEQKPEYRLKELKYNE